MSQETPVHSQHAHADHAHTRHARAQHVRTQIDRHFAGRLRPPGEQEMRAHLVDCVSCRGYYNRHLLAAKFDPSALAAVDRLGAGLGLRSRSPFRWKRLLSAPPILAGALTVAACLFVFLRPQASLPPEYAVRGGADDRTGLIAFRAQADGTTTPAEGTIAADDALAFAYSNQEGFRYLLVFGVDEHRHVYWYHPAWTRAEENPSAVPIATTQTITELPEAVRHSIDGSRLRIFGIFSHRPLGVRQIEKAVSAGAGESGGSILSGTAQRVVELRVNPR